MLRSNRGRRSGLWIATSVTALLTVVVGYGLMSRLRTDAFNTLHDTLETWQLPLTLVRCGVIALVALSWHPALDALQKRGVLLPHHADRLRRMHVRTVTWLVVMELLLGQALLVKPLAWLASGEW